MTAVVRLYVYAAILLAAAFALVYWKAEQHGEIVVRRAEIAPLLKRIDTLTRVRDSMTTATQTKIDTADAKTAYASAATAKLPKTHQAASIVDSVTIRVHDTTFVVPVEVTQRFIRDSVALAAEVAAREAEHAARVELQSKDSISTLLITAQSGAITRLKTSLDIAERRPTWTGLAKTATVLYVGVRIAQHFHVLGLK